MEPLWRIGLHCLQVRDGRISRCRRYHCLRYISIFVFSKTDVQSKVTINLSINCTTYVARYFDWDIYIQALSGNSDAKVKNHIYLAQKKMTLLTSYAIAIIKIHRNELICSRMRIVIINNIVNSLSGDIHNSKPM